MLVASVWGEVWQVIAEEPYSFVVGALVGYFLRGRYRIVREKYNSTKEDE